MKIILKKDVGGVGRSGEVKEVADGYAMNFLIARGFADQATPKKLAAHEKEVAQYASIKKSKEEGVAKDIRSLEGARIEMKARATEKGGLFKAVGKKEVCKAILDQKKKMIPEGSVQLDHPVKEIGEHTIKISALGAEAKFTLSVSAV